MPKGKPNKRYTGEFKQKVVETMLKEKLSYHEAARRFEISDHKLVSKWERIYIAKGVEGLYIKRRIDMFKGIISYTPKTKIIATDTEKIHGSLGLYKWADIQNVKELSKAINIASKYQASDHLNLENILYSKYAQKGILSDKLNHISTEIDELNMKIKVAKNAHTLKAVSDESRSLSGRKKDKFDTEHSKELTAYTKAVRQLKEWYPDGKVLSPESMEKKINALMKERSELNQEYSVLNSEIKELNYARQTFYDYYKNKQNEHELKRKKDELE